MKRDLIARIKMRAQDPKLRTDGCRWSSQLRPVYLAKPAALKVIAEADVKLGFKLPALLRTLYKQVANGGFGPLYGITGLDAQGWMDADLALPELYLELRGFRELRWPDRMLPICYGGGTIHWSIDCSSQDTEMVEAEGSVFWRKGYSFEQWMEKWVNGTLE